MRSRAQWQELWQERRRRSRPAADQRRHADAAMAWLCAAQDAGEDRGVAYGYQMIERWLRSYPETTGYIIPTFLNWAQLTGDDSFRARAIEMAEWELAGQLPAGAIPNLTGGDPTVFDTGQVIFGWVACHRATGDARYLEAARRGAEWLLQQQDEQGVWRHDSDAGGPGRVYNVRSAWALLELHAISGEGRYAEAARAFADWAMSQERERGWFDSNCLTEDRQPLLHTIAYTARGLLECGRLLGEARYLQASLRTATELVAQVRDDGWMAGRFDADWQGRVPWACLTGQAQIGIVWHRLASLGLYEDPKPFERAAERVSDFLMRTQDRESANPGLRGGIRGSYPASGAYGHWRVLNWATKFFVDLMMCEMAGDRSLELKG